MGWGREGSISEARDTDTCLSVITDPDMDYWPYQYVVKPYRYVNKNAGNYGVRYDQNKCVFGEKKNKLIMMHMFAQLYAVCIFQIIYNSLAPLITACAPL